MASSANRSWQKLSRDSSTLRVGKALRGDYSNFLPYVVIPPHSLPENAGPAFA